MSAPVRSSHLRPLSKGGSVDWSGLEVTGEVNLVDGWWTAAELPIETTRRYPWPARQIGGAFAALPDPGWHL
jgi:hypothetical protein